jgi:N-succinyldiaminopimelate aminotransferase
MNPKLSLLQPYPFERLRQLFSGVQPNPALRPISLGIGEPKHATPDFIKQALARALDTGLAGYPATAGEPALREACAAWVQRRYGVQVDPATQVLPVNGSREALFAFAQTVIDPTQPGATVVFPNPFYQIYEGAALLGAATPHCVASDPARNFAPDWDSVPEAVWATTQLLFVCSPGNPTGAVMPLDEWRKLFALSDRHGFVIASDECYSEIYFRNEPPLGGLEAAMRLGRSDFKNLLACPSAATYLVCAAALWPATRRWSSPFCSTAPTTAAPWAQRCRRRASRPGTTRPMWWKTGACTARSSPRSRRCWLR